VDRVPSGGGLDRVLSLTFDSSKEALAEADGGVPLPSTGTGNGTASYSETSPQSAEILVHTSAAGLVLIRNVFDRNWRATVDGRSAPVLRTDFVLQGGLVPAGTHRIELRYDDPGIRLGLAISATAWAIGLALILWLRTRR
jgi:hypothetical protein